MSPSVAKLTWNYRVMIFFLYYFTGFYWNLTKEFFFLIDRQKITMNMRNRKFIICLWSGDSSFFLFFFFLYVHYLYLRTDRWNIYAKDLLVFNFLFSFSSSVGWDYFRQSEQNWEYPEIHSKLRYILIENAVNFLNVRLRLL